MRLVPVVVLGCVSVAWSTPSADAQVRLERVASGLSAPVFLTAPANDARAFIVERAGRVRILQNGSVLPTPFLDITSLTNTTGEHGLLGLAFDPDYATNRRFYTYHIDAASGDSVISRFTTSAVNSSLADLSSRQTVFTIDQPTGRTNHKAGWIGFRPGESANNLYVASGDGGGGNDPDNFAQNLNSNLGKTLRLNVSGTGSATAPADNPFVGGATTADDFVWNFGLRNHYRNSFDRQSGAFLIADVGQDRREEINVELATTPGGRNYGWRAREGSIDNPAVADPAPANHVNPAFDYPHNGNTNAPGLPTLTPTSRGSITGGYVYRGTRAPSLAGKYIFGDYVSGRFGSLDFNTTTGTLTNFQDITAGVDPLRSNFPGFRLASFGEDAFGELYVMNLNNGNVFRFTERALVPEPASLSLLLPAMLALTRRNRGTTGS